MDKNIFQIIQDYLRKAKLPPVSQQQFDCVYYPFAKLILERSNEQIKPLVVGINGAQGSGKSVLSEILKLILEYISQKSIIILSLDALYKTKQERLEMSNNLHPLFETRGVPGTHDIPLGLSILGEITQNNLTLPVQIPVFDKKSDDRLPIKHWTVINQPVDIILFEGWCVGSIPQSDGLLIKPVNNLERYEDSYGLWRKRVNFYLGDTYQKLFSYIDFLCLIQIPGFEVVYQNRLLQEQVLTKLSKSDAMSDTQIARFVQFYQRITESTQENMPSRADVLLQWLPNHQYQLL